MLRSASKATGPLRSESVLCGARASRALGEIFGRLGAEGTVVIEEYAATYLAHQFFEGARWDGGFVSPAFIDDQARQQTLLTEPRILVTDHTIAEPAQIVRLLEQAVQTLAAQALAQTQLIGADVVKSIEAMIAAIDKKLSDQINQILHNPDFQKLEGAWRGLHYMVNNTETDEFLKIRVMNISKQDLGKTLKRYKGTAWDQSPLFKKVYEEEYGQFGGEPFGCLVGDYYFDQSPQDVEMLTEMSKVCAAAHAPFIAAASPTVMQMNSWQELANPRDLTKIFTTPEYAAWRSLRESEDSRYIGLAMPRFLARLPYGAKTDPVEEFDFEEDATGPDEKKYTWANAAYAMAINITRSFKLYGWCSRIRGIESGGAVEGLPTHTFPTDDGGVDMTCPTEIGITDRREAELAKAGFMPLVHKKNSDLAAFIGAQSLHKPAVYDDPDRLRRPIRRVGAGPDARWEEMDWDEALDLVADRLVEVAAANGGPDAIGAHRVGPLQVGDEQRLRPHARELLYRHDVPPEVTSIRASSLDNRRTGVQETHRRCETVRVRSGA